MQYRPLDRSEDEIRLLTLFPSRGDFSSPISATLAHYSLRGVPASRRACANPHDVATDAKKIREPRFSWGDYVALSYDWRSPDNPVDIVVNGQTMKVRRNLEGALRHLRDSPEAAAGLKLWVDAMCINQDNIEERSAEVKRMKDIYKTARSVISWLGPEFEGLETAIGLVENLDRQSRILQHPTVFLSPWARNRGVFTGAVRPLHKLLGNAYWQRLWIIQELAFGGGDVWIVCGTRRFQLDGLGRTAKFILDAFTNLSGELAEELSQNEILELSEWAWRIGQLYSIGQTATDPGSITSAQHVDHVVRLGQHAAATDPRDKVYGLLGLLGDGFAREIVPDYTHSLQQVYTDFVRGFVSTFGNLNVILLKSSEKRPHGWPSWIPRLDREPEEDGAVLHTHYRAGGENVLDVTFPDDGRLLECYGIRIEIGARPVGAAQPEPVGPKPHSSGHRRRTGRRADNEDASLSRLLSAMGRRQLDPGESTADGITGQVFRNLPLPPGVTDIGAPGSLEWIQSGGSRELSSMDPSSLQAAEAITRSMQSLEQMDLALRSLEQRKPAAFTASGHFVWAYEPLHETDIVCVLLGCSYPVVLRPRGEHFEVVSECYIYEIMAGEALELLGSEEVPLECFTLC